METTTASLPLDRLHAAGLTDVTAVEPVEGGMAAHAGLAIRRDGTPLFVESFPGGLVHVGRGRPGALVDLPASARS